MGHRRDAKDAEDLKYALFWYREDEATVDRVYDLDAPDSDVAVALAGCPDEALAHLLVRDAREVLGGEQCARLRSLWTARAETGAARVAALARGMAGARLDGWLLGRGDAASVAAHIDVALRATGPLATAGVNEASEYASDVEV